MKCKCGHDIERHVNKAFACLDCRCKMTSSNILKYVVSFNGTMDYGVAPRKPFNLNFRGG